MDQFKPMLEAAMAKLNEQLAQVAETKKVINTICGWAGQPPLYPDLEPEAVAFSGGFRKDQFYGQPLSTVVRQILEARKAANLGPASVTEIHEAMIKGGYKFDTDNDDNARRSLRQSLNKNTAIFHKIPTGEYGLRSWYPKVREPRVRPAEASPAEAGASVATTKDEDFDFEAKEKELSIAKETA